MRRTLFAIPCLLMFWQPSAEAAMIVQYPFATDTAPLLGAGVQSSNYDASHLSDFFVADDGFGSVLQAYPSSGSTDFASAAANNSYFSITVTASGGSDLDLGLLQFEVGKGGSSDPRGYFIRTSVDSFASDLFSTLLPSGAQQAPALKSINLSGSPVFQNLSSIEFRFFVFTPNPSGSSVDFRNLELSSAANSVPEPASLWLIGTGGLLLWGRRGSMKQDQ